MKEIKLTYLAYETTLFCKNIYERMSALRWVPLWEGDQESGVQSRFQEKTDGSPQLREFRRGLFTEVWEGVGKPSEVVQSSELGEGELLPSLEALEDKVTKTWEERVFSRAAVAFSC